MCFIAQRDPRRARLDPLHVRLGPRGAFGINCDEPPAVKRLVTRREQLPVAVSSVRVVRSPVHGNHAQCNEEPRAEAVPEERGGGKVVHLARDDRAHEQRIDQVVRVIDAEQHRTRKRYALQMPDLHALEEEPDPESRDHPHDGVEGIHARLGGISHPSCRLDG
jgi:hypothetical protein